MINDDDPRTVEVLLGDPGGLGDGFLLERPQISIPQERSEQIMAGQQAEVPAGSSFPNALRRGLSLCISHALMTARQIVSSSIPSSKRLPTRSMICCGSCIPIILKGKGKAYLQDSEILASLAGYASMVTRSLDTAIL